jgi:hypothetical protein
VGCEWDEEEGGKVEEVEDEEDRMGRTRRAGG